MTCPAPSYLSLSARVLVNAEAMNMVEALGNVVRHRKASVVYKTGEGRYEVRTVPVISGEAVRHAIQAALADIAAQKGWPVCAWCRRHELVKRGVRALIENADELERLAKEGLAKAEKKILEGCVVEDVGGFLTPLKAAPVKRTSVLEVGYMLPVMQDGKILYGFDVQFHVRHAPSAQTQAGGGEEQPQTIYNIESSSSLYSLGINVELWRIGVVQGEGDCEQLDDRRGRVEATLAALAAVLNGDVRIGGHWSSYRPAWSVESAVAVFSSPMPISAIPAVEQDYEAKTQQLAKDKAEVYKKVLRSFSYDVLIYRRGCEQEGCVADLGAFVKKLLELGLKYAGHSQR
mgnify:CR=1 FL=1